MTLVAVWHAEDRLYAIADTRIIRNSGNVLTEHGPKILSLAIVCHQPSETGFFDKVVYAKEAGFAYSGASLPAMATHALASIFLSHMASVPDAPAPSMADVAGAIAKIAKSYMKEVGALNGPEALFQSAVFGWCPDKQKLRAFRLMPRIEGGDLHVDVYELSSSDPEDTIILGSCVELFRGRIKTRRDAADKQILKDRAPLAALKSIIDGKEHDTVGGHIQRAWVTQGGFEVVATGQSIEPSIGGRNYGLFVLGFDTHQVDQIGSYVVSTVGQI
jgi:hypothetical protein